MATKPTQSRVKKKRRKSGAIKVHTMATTVIVNVNGEIKELHICTAYTDLDSLEAIRLRHKLAVQREREKYGV